MRAKDMTITELIGLQRPGYALDQRFYTDPQIYALEMERIVLGDWLLVGHESEVAEPGQYKVFNAAGESAIVVRGSDNELRAFANVCRHRGSLVCLEQSGEVKNFRCPYHGWTYDIDGKLIAARDMPDEFDKKTASDYCRCPSTRLSGLMLLSFADDPPSLAGAKRDMAEPLAVFGFEKLKVAAQKSYAIPANWKLAVENYMECYHCATAHPDYAKMHTLMLEEKQRDRLQGQMRARMDACGMRDMYIDYTHTKAPPGEISYGYSRTALFEGYKTGSRDGSPVAPLLGELSDYDGGASDFVIGPLLVHARLQRPCRLLRLYACRHRQLQLRRLLAGPRRCERGQGLRCR